MMFWSLKKKMELKTKEAVSRKKIQQSNTPLNAYTIFSATATLEV